MTKFDDKPTLSLAKAVQIKAKKPKGPRKIKAGTLRDPKRDRHDGNKAGRGRPSGRDNAPNKPIRLERVANLPANRMAAYEVAALVILHDHYLDKALAENDRLQKLYASDRQFVRLLVTSLLRHHRQLADLLDDYVQRTPPADAMLILMMGAAQLLILKTPTHAALSTSVDLMRAAGFEHMTGMTNAVLRKVSSLQVDFHAPEGLAKNIAPQILSAWHNAYGKARVDAFLPQLFSTPKIDLTFADADKAKQMAETMNGHYIAPLSVRAPLGGTITDWPGFEDGEWWVQDIAAAMPANLLGDVAQKRVIDMCAAPGGKTAQLIAGGAKVTALEIDPKRANRLSENLKRLKQSCIIEVTDALDYTPDGKYDAVLLDAPCSATGTIRKRPDVMRKDITDDLALLPDMQKQMARRALSWLHRDGILIYATCSLQAEEGEDVIESLTTGPRAVARLVPITQEEAGPFANALRDDGTLRLLPDSYQAPQMNDKSDDKADDITASNHGNDGFFIARLQQI